MGLFSARRIRKVLRTLPIFLERLNLGFRKEKIEEIPSAYLLPEEKQFEIKDAVPQEELLVTKKWKERIYKILQTFSETAKRYYLGLNVAKKTLHLSSVGVFIFFLWFFFLRNSSNVFTATYNFVQNSWSGGADTVGVATHSLNQGGWNKYYSASSTINFSSLPTLNTSTYSFTDDAVTSTTGGFPVGGGGFANGMSNNTTYSAGTTNISLSSSVVNLNQFSQPIQTFPGSSFGLGAKTIVQGSYTYVLNGAGATGFYRYNISSNSWDTFTNLPAGSFGGSFALDNNYAYVAAGNNSFFYRHTLSDTSSAWTAYSPALPSSFYQGGIVLDNQYIYVLPANGGSSFFRHTLADTTSAWDVYTALPATCGADSKLAIDSQYLYVMQGGGTGFWRHTLADTTSAWETFTNTAGANTSASMAIDNQYAYFVQGGNSYASYRHSLSSTSTAWESFVSLPGTAAAGSVMVKDSQNLYVMAGGANANIYRHTLSNTSSAWTSITPLPGTVTTGGSMSLDLTNNNVYVLQGGATGFWRHTLADTTSAWQGQSTYPPLPATLGTNSFTSLDSNYVYVLPSALNVIYRHSLADNTLAWDSFTTLPASANASGHLLVDSNNAYVLRGSGTDVYQHSISTTTGAWNTYTALPGTVNAPRAAIDNNNIYVLRGNLYTDVYVHTLANTTDAWTTYTALPSAASTDALIMSDGQYLYVAKGAGSALVYRHTLANTTDPWDTVAALPGSIGNGGRGMIAGQYIYVLPAGTYSNLFRHTLANTSTAWENFGSLPVAIGPGGGVYVDNNFSYVLYGNALYRHSLSTISGSWTSFGVPESISGLKPMVGDGGNNLYIAGVGTSFYDFVINQTTYPSSGNWTSASIRLQAQKLNTLTWNAAVPSYCGANAVRIQVATSTDGSSWSAWFGPDGTSGSYFTSSPAAMPSTGALYFKYIVYLQTANNTFTPSLSDLTVSYDQYNPSGTIISSVYNGEDSKNVMGDIKWNALTPGSGATTLSFQIRTAGDSTTILSNAWAGPDGTPTTWFSNSAGNSLPSSLKDGSNDQYFQYRVKFDTTDGAYAPILRSVTSTYVVNAPPQIQNVTAVQNADGSVTISYQVMDIDTDLDTNSVGVLTPYFQYCRNGSNCATITALSAGATSTKAVNGSTYTPYSATWYPRTDFDGIYDTNPVVKVIVDDLQAANNIASSTYTMTLLDTMAPQNASVIVDASTTPAAIYLTASDTSTPVQYRLALSSGGLGSATYSTLTSRTSIVLPGNPDTIYAQFKDAYGNETNPVLIYATTPETPQNLIVQDTTNSKNSPPDYREFLAWKVVNQPSPGFGAYEVWRSTDNVTYSKVGNITDRSVNFFTDNTVPGGVQVWYKVLTTDSLGNRSFNSETVLAIADGQQNRNEGGGGSGTGPIITNIATSSISASSVTVTWETDALSNSTVSYSTTPGIFSNSVTVGSMVNDHTHNGPHTVILANLTPDTTYYFSVKSTDINGNYTTDDNGTAGYTFHTTPGPTITAGPTPISVLNNAATITWQTSLSANATIFYSETSDFAGASSTSDLINYSADHSLTLTDLKSSTKYYYYVRSADGSGNIVVDQNVDNGVPQYYSFFTTNDITPPVITNANTAVNTTTAAITWHTNENADSQVYYGLTPSTMNSSTALDAFLTNNHSVTIYGLAPNTTYYYQVLSRDGNGNLGASTGNLSFLTGTPVDTRPPVISNITTSSVGLTYATVNWSTNKDANATVDFGTTESYGNLVGSLYDYTTSTHSVNLTDLVANTLYYFRVNSADVIGNNASATGTFVTTPDLTPPDILTTSTLVNDTAAFVNWITNERALAFVDYGLSETTLDTEVAVTSTFNTNHSLPLAGLTPVTTYYYTITTADLSANTTTIGPFSFTTLHAGEQVITVTKIIDNTKFSDTSLPTISNVQVTDIQPFKATVTWTTDKDSSSLVKYGQSSNYGFLAGDEETMVQSHSVPLENLEPGTTYHIKVKSIDKNGNTGVSSDITFTTLNVDGTIANPSEQTQQTSEDEKQAALDKLMLERIRKAPVKVILGMLNAVATNPFIHQLTEDQVIHSFTDLANQIGTAPLIVGLRPQVEVHGNSATVRWSTDKKTSGLVSFAKEAEYLAGSDRPYTTSIVDSDTLSTVHTVELASLEPATRYHFQVVSKGEIGPEARSKDYTFETEAVLPEVSDAKVTDVKATEATVSWKSNVPTASNLEFTNLDTKKTLTSGDPALLITHVFTLKDLIPGSKYSLVIKAKNESGQESVSNPLAFETVIDKVAPQVLSVSANSTLYPGANAKVQTIVSWDTDEMAESQLFYQEGVAKTDNIKTLPIDSNYTTKHFVVLTAFKPGSVYKYWIESTDQSGNKSKSEPFTTLTPTEKQTIIDIISNNFQSVFGWTKNMGI
jgi:N-acetylneuraminic acid mutarotase